MDGPVGSADDGGGTEVLAGSDSRREVGEPGARRLRRGRSRRIRLVLGVVLTVLVLVALDRLAALAAAARLASSVQSSQHLSARPRVTIHGFPFLTQVVRGSYGDVELAAQGPVVEGGVAIDGARARLRGVRVGVADAVRGTVRDLPVASGTGSATLGYASLDALLRRYGGPVGSAFSVSGGVPGRARIHGPLGLSVDVAAEVRDGRLLVTPDPAALQAIPEPLRSTVTAALAAPIDLPNLPFNVRLASGRLEPGGLVLSAVAHDSVFPVR